MQSANSRSNFRPITTRINTPIQRNTAHQMFSLINSLKDGFDSNILDRVQFLLVIKQEDVNEQDVMGNTALHYAVCFSECEIIIPIIELLIKHGANINIKNRFNQTPLDIAKITLKDTKLFLQVENILITAQHTVNNDLKAMFINPRQNFKLTNFSFFSIRVGNQPAGYKDFALPQATRYPEILTKLSSP
jgi:ankyrin repeat protein